jgi:DNA-directed RNA polymerase specialized sigma24 family protein
MPPEFAEAVEMVRCGAISGREAAQLCGISHSTFRERMRESKAHAEDRDLSLK